MKTWNRIKQNRDEVCFSQWVDHCQVNTTSRKYKVSLRQSTCPSFPQGCTRPIILKGMGQNNCYWTSSAKMSYIYSHGEDKCDNRQRSEWKDLWKRKIQQTRLLKVHIVDVENKAATTIKKQQIKNRRHKSRVRTDLHTPDNPSSSGCHDLVHQR